MKIYALYFDRTKKELTIKNWSSRELKLEEGKIYSYNDCIYLALDRKILRQKAKEIQDSWISKCEKELEELKSIRVKTKY